MLLQVQSQQASTHLYVDQLTDSEASNLGGGLYVSDNMLFHAVFDKEISTKEDCLSSQENDHISSSTKSWSS